MRNLDLTALRAFVTTVEMGGVTRAAHQLHLTQSAVSMQLKRLEENMGLSLMDRSNRRIGLTGQGELLLSYARKMLSLNDEVWGRLTADEFEGEIVLGVPHDIVYPHIPKILKRFNHHYPKVKIRLVSSYTMNLKEAFERGEIDLILTTEIESSKEAEILTELPMVWVGALEGRAFKERPIRLASQERCIFRSISQRALDDVGIKWEMAVDTDSSMTVSACLSADLGVEARLAMAVPNDLEVIEHGGELPPLPVIKSYIYLPAQPQNAFITELGSFIKEAYQA